MKIEAILFDLGKVIIDFDFDPIIQKMSATSANPAEFQTVVQDPEFACSYDCGTITTREFYEQLCERGGLRMDYAAFREMWCSIFSPELLISENLLRALRQRYPLILVSNTNEAHAGYIAERYSLLNYFDEKIFSFEIGVMKPDRRIYERAIAASRKEPQTLFFIDDREENVRGAREMGIHSHQFRCEAGLVAALRDAGVQIGS